MLLAIDIGNTNTVLGLFEGKTLRADWRLETRAARTGDEYAALVATQYAHWWPAGLGAGTVALPPARIALFSIGLNAFGFLALAALSGYLAESLRRADIRLQQASTQLADLQAFSQHVIDSLGSGLAQGPVEVAGDTVGDRRRPEGGQVRGEHDVVRDDQDLGDQLGGEARGDRVEREGLGQGTTVVVGQPAQS